MVANPIIDGPFRIQGLPKSKAEQLHQLVKLVAEEANLTKEHILGPDQDMYAVAYRRALWWCFRDGYGMTLQNIGKLFTSRNGGPFNHSGIRTGIHKVYDLRKERWSERKKTWVQAGSELPSTEVVLREALVAVAAAWNELNPQNQLHTWTNTQ